MYTLPAIMTGPSSRQMIFADPAVELQNSIRAAYESLQKISTISLASLFAQKPTC